MKFNFDLNDTSIFNAKGICDASDFSEYMFVLLYIYLKYHYFWTTEKFRNVVIQNINWFSLLGIINLSKLFLQIAAIHFRENEKLHVFLPFSNWPFYELLINVCLLRAINITFAVIS